MGKLTGFLEYQRKNYGYRPVAERVNDYREQVVPLTAEELSRQGARCMDCGIPFCHAMGCPLFNLIPEWNDLVYKNKWREAYERLSLTNNFPEVTGRICPAPCETSCTLSINDAPVTIKQIELAIIERAYSEGWVVPRPPDFETGKKVAVIGSGPAGLAAAQQLRRLGHRVTVFEKTEHIGGIMRYGIPDFKLEKQVLDRRLEQLRAEGVEFETGVVIGEDLSVRYLRRTYDAILLALGAGEPRDLQVPGRGLEGIHHAMEYLTLSNSFRAGEIPEQQLISARNKTVLVIGGGDTGSDCVGTAIRQKAKKVYQFEILPKPEQWDNTFNPSWPAWPQILRTSTSHEEGCERQWSVTTKQFTGKDGRVHQASCARVEWKPDPASGQMKMSEIPGSDFTIDADLVLLSMGFLHVKHSRLLAGLGIGFDNRGNIMAGSNHATNVSGVFSAGDSSLGASLVVRALYNGREAAKSIDAFLS
ncbi:MAG TPA: glutamate synthase subunit beta [Chitinivibrionales bacterium]|nr:glutamate synthase subunit beta [Chitinivibrionales bacterium]